MKLISCRYKAIIGFITTLTLVLGLFSGALPGAGLRARAEGTVYYTDYSVTGTSPVSEKKSVTDYTVIDDTVTVWSAGGVYVVKSDTLIAERITAKGNGDVRLILCDGATLEAPQGITVEEDTAFHNDYTNVIMKQD